MLLDYNYEIVYRRGEDQEAADFLSRNALDEVNATKANQEENVPGLQNLENVPGFKNLDFEDYSREEIRAKQANDQHCRDIQNFRRGNLDGIDSITQGLIRRHKRDFIEDDHGILWKRNGETSKLLIATRDHVTDIIHKAHDSHIGGHRDSEKTLERIQRVYWWLTMRRDVSEYIRSCHNSQQLRGPRCADDLKCPLQPLKIPEKFNERIHTDLMGPLRSITSNKYILVMSDSFTKWSELIPLPNKS